MDLPDTLAELIAAMRGYIGRVDAINAGAQAGNAEAHLRTLRSFVVVTPELDSKFEAAAVAIRALAEIGNDPYRFRKAGRGWAANATGMALMEVDRLEDALIDARPSRLARDLGMDWYF
jgi:hypothetical protein